MQLGYHFHLMESGGDTDGGSEAEKRHLHFPSALTQPSDQPPLLLQERLFATVIVVRHH
jgi:hypothetical protein